MEGYCQRSRIEDDWGRYLGQKETSKGGFWPIDRKNSNITTLYILTFCVTDLKVNFMNKLNELELYQTLVMIIEWSTNWAFHIIMKLMQIQIISPLSTDLLQDLIVVFPLRPFLQIYTGNFVNKRIRTFYAGWRRVGWSSAVTFKTSKKSLNLSVSCCCRCHSMRKDKNKLNIEYNLKI